MKLFLPFFIVFVVWLKYELGKSSKSNKKAHEDFLLREQKANLTRRQNIDSLDYITIPLKSLPFLENCSEKILSCQETVKKLADKRILNLAGITNTDLKLKYGAANLPALSSYDENFTILINTLNTWADCLIEEDMADKAVTVLEYAIQAGADSSRIYLTLANEYSKNGDNDKIEELIKQAKSLNTLTKDSIIKKLTVLKA